MKFLNNSQELNSQVLELTTKLNLEKYLKLEKGNEELKSIAKEFLKKEKNYKNKFIYSSLKSIIWVYYHVVKEFAENYIIKLKEISLEEYRIEFHNNKGLELVITITNKDVVNMRAKLIKLSNKKFDLLITTKLNKIFEKEYKNIDIINKIRYFNMMPLENLQSNYSKK